jgi:anti-sigma factor RsiW
VIAPARCPSDLALESFLLDPARGSCGAHVDACPRCQARVAAMREQGEEFRRFVFPATVEAVEDAAARRRPRLAFLFAPVGAVAALAAALLVFVRLGGGPPADYLGVKGSQVTFTAFVSADGGARALEDGAVVPASAALRFQVNAKEGCYLWIMSLDAKGQVSRLYPPKGTPPTPHAGGAVPGGAVLDGEPGPERLFAVCAPPEMAWGEVRRAAETPERGEETVRKARALREPLAGALQSTLLVEKRP